MKFIRIGSNKTAKILSILLASVLWFHIATDAEYDYKIDIPIMYIEPTKEYMLARKPPETVNVYVKVSGKHLLFYVLKSMIDPESSYISVNLAGLLKDTHRITLEKENIYLSVESGISIERILSDSTFPVIIDRKKKQTVPVDVDNLPDYTVEGNYVLSGKITSIPEFVIIEGPEDYIDAIHAVKVKTLEKTMISQGDSLVHANLNTNNSFVTVNPGEVNIRFPVEPLRTKLFRGIPVTFKNIPRKFRNYLSPDTLSVYIQGPESIVSRARSEDISVTVNFAIYRNQIEQGDSLLKPVVTYPDGITDVSTTPGMLRISSPSSGS